MRRRHNEIIVDIRDMDIHGEVLDMGFQNHGIIFRALKKNMLLNQCEEAAVALEPSMKAEDYDWVSGYPDSLPFKDGIFDSVIMFFSLSLIRSRKRKDKTIKEVQRVLKDGGMIYIWDMNKRHIPGFSRKLKVVLPGMETVRMDIDHPNLLTHYNMNGLLPVMGNYFKIVKSVDFGEYYYLEALKGI